MRRRFLALLLIAFAPWLAQAADAPLAIRTADGHVRDFTVEVASSEEQRETGLMDRPSMPLDHGMLFDFGADRAVAMWMKDTLIPLDMLFIDRAGKIVGIRMRAVPQSKEIIGSPGPVRAVLEVNGGTAERLGIAVGDRVEFPLFAQ